MTDRLLHARWWGPVAVVGVVALGCNSGSSASPNSAQERPTQGAVSAAVRQVSRSVALAVDPREEGATGSVESRDVPEMRVTGSGLAARAQVAPDEDHQSTSVVRVPNGWALTWGDRNHTTAMFARLDEQGRPLGTPVVVRESRSDEEDVWSPAIAFNGREFGVAWSDPANGRVRFSRLSAEGRATGRATVVHEGLEMPLSTRVVWNGSEYGVAVGMSQGVYFARVNSRGERVGDGVVVAEGTRVAGLDDLSATGNGFQLVWHDGDERGAQHQARITRGGQVVDAAPHVRALRLAAR
jgi:hypothetical protein